MLFILHGLVILIVHVVLNLMVTPETQDVRAPNRAPGQKFRIFHGAKTYQEYSEHVEQFVSFWQQVPHTSHIGGPPGGDD